MLSSRFVILAAIIALAACSQGQDQSTDQSPGQSERQLENDGVEVLGSAILALADGSVAGSASLIANTDGEVSIEVDVQNIEPGAHGFHLHETGACDAPDFKSAGGHLNPLVKSHGSKSPGGKHLGDLPNLTADETGSGALTIAIDGEQPQVMEWIFDGDGTAVVIHAGPDDYKTDPSGDAGARVACGVLTR